MRKILASFLMFTMFASALICGCGHEAQAESSVSSHSHHEDGDHHHGSTVDQDCQKADMQLPAHMGISKPDLKNSVHFDFAFANETPVWPVSLASNRGIRGPPPWEEPSQNKPSILLTTQRLRI
jgi:hypothetical protein